MEKIIAELPDNYSQLIKLGNDYMDQGMYALAIECYQRGLAIDSTSSDVLIDLGACYHAVGGGEKAIEFFEKALVITPNHVIGHFNTGIVYGAFLQWTGNQRRKLTTLAPRHRTFQTLEQHR